MSEFNKEEPLKSNGIPEPGKKFKKLNLSQKNKGNVGKTDSWEEKNATMEPAKSKTLDASQEKARHLPHVDKEKPKVIKGGVTITNLKEGKGPVATLGKTVTVSSNF